MNREERVRFAADIFNEHGPKIRLLIRRHVRDENTVDDIYQNIFLSLVRTPPSNLTFLLAYLSKVARNQTTDGIRRATSYGNCIERYARRRRNSVSDDAPETKAIRSERIRMLLALVESHLPAHMADVLVERYVHNRDTTETATKLGIKERTVSRYTCIGLKRIRQLVDQGKINMNVFL